MSPIRAMMIGTMLVLTVGAILLTGRRSATGQDEEANVRDTGFGLYVATDRREYSAGQPIEMELCIFNRTGQPTALQFRSGQRFDFAITDTDGKEAWRWSRGRMFTMALGTETVGPARTELTYKEKFTATLAPGTYKLTGTVTARNMPMAASLTIEVR
jgi:hypothetical protein